MTSSVIKTAPLVLGLFFCGLVAGCGGTVAIPQWQRAVEAYVHTVGNSDLSALRDIRDEEGRPAISANRGGHVHRSNDVRGILLGSRIIEGRPHYIFLVAEVERGKVDNVRVATLSAARGDLHWFMGKPSSEAMSRYRGVHAQPALPTWPYPQDAFDLDVSERTLTVVDRSSQAQWSLQLPPRRGIGAEEH